jgi:hypothetical protein
MQQHQKEQDLEPTSSPPIWQLRRKYSGNTVLGAESNNGTIREVLDADAPRRHKRCTRKVN